MPAWTWLAPAASIAMLGAAIASLLFGIPLMLGLDPKELVMLVLTFVVGTITLRAGRTNIMQGLVQLVIFAAFLVLALVP